MKINTLKKAIVGTMAMAMGAAVAGSISGTVAWYQYSTRSTAAYQGAAAHCTENVQIRIRSAEETADWAIWKSDLSASDIATYLSLAVAANGAGRTTAGNKLAPVTSGALAAGEVAETLYKNPIYQYPEMASWGTASATSDYILLPLEIRVLDVNGAETETFLAKNIWITDVTLAARASHDQYVKDDHYDLSDALRVGVSASTDADDLQDYATFAKSASAVKVYGKLDLNGDNLIDKTEGYEFSVGREEITYGSENETAVATSTTKVAADAANTVIGVANEVSAYSIKGKPIGATTATDTLKVNLKIYLEGWAELSNKSATGAEGSVAIKSIWDAAEAVGAEFNVGIRFSAEAHQDNE